MSRLRLMASVSLVALSVTSGASASEARNQIYRDLLVNVLRDEEIRASEIDTKRERILWNMSVKEALGFCRDKAPLGRAEVVKCISERRPEMAASNELEHVQKIQALKGLARSYLEILGQTESQKSRRLLVNAFVWLFRGILGETENEDEKEVIRKIFVEAVK